ncbi:MAG TPA: hypothetical protein VF476_10025, partial [Chitinophagaceae bacterium]
TIFDVLASVNDVVMLEDMQIVNGDIKVHLNGGIDMHLQNASMSVESRKLLGSAQLAGIRRSVNHLDFSKGILKINDLTVQLNNINYLGEKSHLRAKAALVTNTAGTINAKANDVLMTEIFINEFTGDVSIGGINWENADINIITKTRDSSSDRSGASFISLTDINGTNTKLNFVLGDKKINAFIDNITASVFSLKPGEKPLIAGLEMAGKYLQINSNSSQATIEGFKINDQQAGLLENIHFSSKKLADSVDLQMKSISFVPNVQAAIDGELHSSVLRIVRPVITIHSGFKETSSIGLAVFPKGSFDRITIENPFIRFSKQTDNGTWKINWDGSKTVQQPLIITNLVSDGSSFSASQMDMLLKNFVFIALNGKKVSSGNAEVGMQLNDISYLAVDKSWKATATSLVGKNFVFDNLGKKKSTLNIDSWKLKNAFLSNQSVNSFKALFKASKQLSLEQVNASYSNSDDRFTWNNIAYNKANQLLTLDSFSYTPALDRDAFTKKKQFQADYFSLKTGKTIIGKFDVDAYFEDSIVRINKMVISDVVFNDFRDKRPPFLPGIIKPLTTNRIKKIPFKLSLDSLILNNANVSYAELNAETKQTGTIPISRITLVSSPIKNFGYSATDSFRLNVSGYLMDSAFVRIKLVESYTDSLAPFLLVARIGEADLRIMNPVLTSLSSIKLKSGYMDSLIMRVNGDEYYAYGELDMYYHDLKIQLLKLGDKKTKKFKLALVNFLANSFVVKNKNSSRTGLVFFARNRDRSSLNYLVKMLMSGINSSIGVKTTRKQFQPHKKALRQRNLPPVDYDY